MEAMVTARDTARAGRRRGRRCSVAVDLDGAVVGAADDEAAGAASAAGRRRRRGAGRRGRVSQRCSSSAPRAGVEAGDVERPPGSEGVDDDHGASLPARSYAGGTSTARLVAACPALRWRPSSGARTGARGGAAVREAELPAGRRPVARPGAVGGAVVAARGCARVRGAPCCGCCRRCRASSCRSSSPPCSGRSSPRSSSGCSARGVPRSGGALLVLLGLTAVVVGSIWLVVAGVVGQAAADPRAAHRGPGHARARGWRRTASTSAAVRRDQRRARRLGASEALGGVGSALSGTFSSLVSLGIGAAIGAFLVYYVLVDWAGLTRWVGGHVGLDAATGVEIVGDVGRGGAPLLLGAHPLGGRHGGADRRRGLGARGAAGLHHRGRHAASRPTCPTSAPSCPVPSRR